MKRKERVEVICKEVLTEFPNIDSLKLHHAVNRGVMESGRIAFEESKERKRKRMERGRYVYIKTHKEKGNRN